MSVGNMENVLLSKNINFNNNEIHNKNSDNAIVMFSGGMDSTVALIWACLLYTSFVG